MRAVYQSRNYNPAQIDKVYARVDYNGEGWRVDEVNAGGWTIRTYVTDDASMFTQEQIDVMYNMYDEGISPPWTLIA